MPGLGDYYRWTVPMAGMTVGDDLASFTMTVPFGGAILDIFQVFGGGDGAVAYQVFFDLFIGGVATPWTSVYTGNGSPFRYHNLEDYWLPGGDVSFRIVLIAEDSAPPPGFDYADLRVGGANSIPAAIPAPASALLALSAWGLMALGHRRASRSGQRRGR